MVAFLCSPFWVTTNGAPYPGARTRFPSPTVTLFSGFRAVMVNREGAVSRAFLTCFSLRNAIFPSTLTPCFLKISIASGSLNRTPTSLRISIDASSSLLRSPPVKRCILSHIPSPVAPCVVSPTNRCNTNCHQQGNQLKRSADTGEGDTPRVSKWVRLRRYLGMRSRWNDFQKRAGFSEISWFFDLS